jgi:hypothetical protein
MSEPDLVVIRPAPSLPPGFLPRGWDGLWLDRSQIPSELLVRPGASGVATAVATGRFEVREDGAVAEVFEVQPHLDAPAAVRQEVP